MGGAPAGRRAETRCRRGVGLGAGCGSNAPVAPGELTARGVSIDAVRVAGGWSHPGMVVRYAVSVTAGVGAVSDYLREETVAERKSRLVDSDRPAIERRREGGALRGWPSAPTRSTRRTMEHGPYDVSALRTWMQWLLNPAAIAVTVDAMAGKAVIVRIPATGRELDQNIWMVKQVLDVGAHGIIFPTVETPEQALMAIRAMRYPQRLGAPDPEPAGLRGTNPRLAARYWGLSVPDYIERADVWRLDPPNGNLLPWILIESPLGVANVREIARQLSERNIGAVLFAGSETGGDMLNTHGGSLEAVAQAIDTVLAAGKEFGLPVAMTSTTNMMERIEQGARLFTGGVTPRATEGSGPLGGRLAQPGNGPPRVRHGDDDLALLRELQALRRGVEGRETWSATCTSVRVSARSSVLLPAFV